MEHNTTSDLPHTPPPEVRHCERRRVRGDAMTPTGLVDFDVERDRLDEALECSGLGMR